MQDLQHKRNYTVIGPTFSYYLLLKDHYCLSTSIIAGPSLSLDIQYCGFTLTGLTLLQHLHSCGTSTVIGTSVSQDLYFSINQHLPCLRTSSVAASPLCRMSTIAECPMSQDLYTGRTSNSQHLCFQRTSIVTEHGLLPQH